MLFSNQQENQNRPVSNTVTF